MGYRIGRGDVGVVGWEFGAGGGAWGGMWGRRLGLLIEGRGRVYVERGMVVAFICL